MMKMKFDIDAVQSRQSKPPVRQCAPSTRIAAHPNPLQPTTVKCGRAAVQHIF